MNKTIQQRADGKYPLGDLDYADSTKIMTRAMMVVSQEAYTIGATEQAAIMQKEIDGLRERIKELEEWFEKIRELPQTIGHAYQIQDIAKQLLTKTQTP